MRLNGYDRWRAVRRSRALADPPAARHGAGVASRRGSEAGLSSRQRPGTGRRALATPLCFPCRVSASPFAHNQQHAYEMSRPDSYRHPSAPTEQEHDSLHKGSNSSTSANQIQRFTCNSSVQLIEFQPDLLIQVTIIPSMLNNNAAVQLLNNNKLLWGRSLPRLIRARPNTRNRARTCRPAGGWGLGGGAGRELTKPATTICSSAVGGLVDKKTSFPMEQTTVAADWPFETQDP